MITKNAKHGRREIEETNSVSQSRPAEEQSAQFPSVTVATEKSTVRLCLCVAL